MKPPPVEKELPLKRCKDYNVGRIPSGLSDAHIEKVMDQRCSMLQGLRETEKKPHRGNLQSHVSLQGYSNESIRQEEDGQLKPTLGMIESINHQMGQIFKETCPGQKTNNISVTEAQARALWEKVRKHPAHKVYQAYPPLTLSVKEIRYNDTNAVDWNAGTVLGERENKIIGGIPGFIPVSTNDNGDCALHAVMQGLTGKANVGAELRFLLIYFVGYNMNQLATVPEYTHLYRVGDVFNVFACLTAWHGYLPITVFSFICQMIPDVACALTGMKRERTVNYGDPFIYERVYLHRDRDMRSVKRIVNVMFVPAEFKPDLWFQPPNHFVLMLPGNDAPTQEELINRWIINCPNEVNPALDFEEILGTLEDEAKRRHFMVSFTLHVSLLTFYMFMFMLDILV